MPQNIAGILFVLLFALLVLVVVVLYQLLLVRRSQGGGADLMDGLDDLRKESGNIETRLREELGRNRTESASAAKEQREELAAQMKSAMETVDAGLASMRNATNERFEELQLKASENAKLDREELGKQIEMLRGTLDGKLKELQESNSLKLDEMRKTVDEKLQGTLEKRLGESFKLVSERLELVHKGLGEMQSLASGVGDLKRVLTNVKTRGTWGEMQLSSLLEQVLTKDQYATNIATKPNSLERVEFAIKLPGRDLDGGQVWLPIDAKFPKEDYERLVDAADRADPEAVELAARALEDRVRIEARAIREKYIDPPHTTDFGILYLPTEGLYAEILRRHGLAERLQLESRVLIAGPTTLAALLNSLQMGFRTLAIEKRSSEVWQVLGAVKTEFGKFGEVMDKVQKKLQEAANVVDDARSRSNVMKRKLKSVEELPSAAAIALLGAPDLVAEASEEAELPENSTPGEG
ncbi:MAG: DNA recombination protein RmuC [Planctomycetes bacterium]|nr:DNA recombination protein RmuC [Planctomycetota bacterium]